MGSFYRRNGAWYIDFYINRKRYKKKIGSCKRKAEEALKKIEADALDIEYELPKPRPTVLFDNLIEEYVELDSRVRKAPVTGEKRDRLTFKHFKRLFPKVKFLSDVTIKHGQLYCAKRKNEGVVNATVNRELRSVKAMLTFAAGLGYIKESPFKALKYLPEPKTKPDFLEVDEAMDLIKGAAEVSIQIEAIVAVAIYAGLRKGEIINLKWADVDWARDQIHVRCDNERRTKSNKYRIVPVEKNLKEILERLRRESGLDSPYLFNTYQSLSFRKYSEPIKGIKSAAKKAGLKRPVNTRMLRTTCCSFWAMTNVPMKQAQLWMGHHDIEITAEIYSMSVPSIIEKHRNSISKLFTEKDNLINFPVKSSSLEKV